MMCLNLNHITPEFLPYVVEHYYYHWIYDIFFPFIFANDIVFDIDTKDIFMYTTAKKKHEQEQSAWYCQIVE